MINKTSLNDYSSRNPVNARIAENMLDVTIMQGGFDNFEKKALLCFSKAYEICKQLIENSPVSVWKVPDYYNAVNYYYPNSDLSTIMKAVTISIVSILTEHLNKKWQEDNQMFLNKLRDGLKNLELSEEKKIDTFSHTLMQAVGRKNECLKAYEILHRGTDNDIIIPLEEFTRYEVNNTEISGARDTNNITREEIITLIKDTVKEAFDKQKRENDEEESLSKEELKKMWEQALYHAKAEIDNKIPHIVYDANNEALSIITGGSHYYGQNETMEDVIKSTVKKYLDENTASEEDIDEIFSEVYGKELVDQVNKEMALANIENDDVQLKQDNMSLMTNVNDNLQKQLDEARKTIEEQEATIEDLNEDIRRYQMRGLPPAKRKGISFGLSPLQADIFGDYIADKLGIEFNNKKKELSLLLNSLFGHGISSLANKMSKTTEAVNDRLYVASIFGPFSPSTAKEISSDWTEDTRAPWDEEGEKPIE